MGIWIRQLSYILLIGSLVIVAIMVIDHEHSASAAASQAQAEADASVYAVEGQGTEVTNIPPGGELPANSVTEANNTTINEFAGEAN